MAAAPRLNTQILSSDSDDNPEDEGGLHEQVGEDGGSSMTRVESPVREEILDKKYYIVMDLFCSW
jgi:hypothetical protein